ncbi:MAG: nitrous oxide reductase accessory protein NosL [Campylobacterales bacterium]|nr:nitrous oxide reductase accessory protein NosL [Campylobacterales bacterium]
MKKVIFFSLMVCSLFGQNLFQSVEPKSAVIIQDGKDKEYCSLCGMHLPTFYKTNHVLKLKDGRVKQFCSIHCLVDFLTNGKVDLKEASEILVVDTNSNKLIDATKAFYVIGSKVKGTMSMVSKYAFSTKDDAVKFQTENGGTIGTFSDALKKATEDFMSDNTMISHRKSEKIAMGEKIFNSNVCDKSKLNQHFHVMSETKVFLKESGVCKNLNEGQLHALALFLTSKDTHHEDKKEPLSVKKEDKCPVCGMFVEPYKKWVAKIEVEDDKYFVFDGAKDMFKFYFEPLKFGAKSDKFKTVFVTDYYDVVGIEAKSAYFVLNSDVFGPMGNELIPFESEQKAQNFIKDHGGYVTTFEKITKEIVYSLDK